MAIPISEQLEAFTTWKTRELFARYGIELIHDGLFTSDRRDVRTLFTFTRYQLVEYLLNHSEISRSLLAQAERSRGIYDKDVLERQGNRYVLYWQDHATRRYEKFYDNLCEGVADWLLVQRGMWLNERDA